jgi:hypothetical protein
MTLYCEDMRRTIRTAASTYARRKTGVGSDKDNAVGEGIASHD